MTLNELVAIQPGELRFPFELRKQISCSLRLLNNTDEQVAFKVKTTSPKKYCVRPNTGTIPPRGSVDVTVTMQSQREAPPDMQCKDKFLVQTLTVPKVTYPSDTPDMFHKDSGHEVFETKLRVLLTPPPQPPSPVAESPDEEGASPKASVFQQNGGSIYLPPTGVIKDDAQLETDLAKLNSELSSVRKDRDTAIQQCQRLQQELTLKASSVKGTVASQAAGFSFLFVFFVGLIGILIGYLVSS